MCIVPKLQSFTPKYRYNLLVRCEAVGYHSLRCSHPAIEAWARHIKQSEPVGCPPVGHSSGEGFFWPYTIFLLLRIYSCLLFIVDILDGMVTWMEVRRWAYYLQPWVGPWCLRVRGIEDEAIWICTQRQISYFEVVWLPLSLHGWQPSPNRNWGYII